MSIMIFMEFLEKNLNFGNENFEKILKNVDIIDVCRFSEKQFQHILFKPI